MPSVFDWQLPGSYLIAFHIDAVKQTLWSGFITFDEWIVAVTRGSDGCPVDIPRSIFTVAKVTVYSSETSIRYTDVTDL